MGEKGNKKVLDMNHNGNCFVDGKQKKRKKKKRESIKLQWKSNSLLEQKKNEAKVFAPFLFASKNFFYLS